MARLVTAKCPHCGAAVRLDKTQDWVTCSYCGTSAFIAKQGSRQPTPLHYPVIRVDASDASRLALIIGVIVAGIVLTTTVGIVVAIAVAGSTVGFVASKAVEQATREDADEPPGAGAAVPKQLGSYSVQGDRKPLLADVNGDGTQDLILLFSSYLGGKSGWRYAAFNGQDGELVWITKRLGNSYYNYVATVTQGWLLLSDEAGQLSGLQLKDGAQAWTTALGDKAEQLCEHAEPNTVLVLTKDRRKIIVDVRTGAQKPGADGAPCRPAQSNPRTLPGRMRAMPAHLLGPAGTDQLDEYRCGGTRLITGAGSRYIPDPCPKQLKFQPDSLERFDVYSIRRFAEDQWILIGVRRPGSKVPMLGLARAGKLAWSLEVPEGNPMAAQEGDPGPVEIMGQNLVVGYELKGSKGWHLTSIQARDGKRLWDIGLSTGDDDIEHLLRGPGRIHVGTDRHVVALEETSARQLFVIGQKGRQQPVPKIPD